jgi:hypothetical protein
MKKYVIALAGVATMCMLLGLVSNALAADANQPKESKKDKQAVVIGTVSVVKDKDGNITGVTVVKGQSETYQITLDATGKELGKEMDGKKVKAIGTLEVKEGVKWLTVKKFNLEYVKEESKRKDKLAEKPSEKR